MSKAFFENRVDAVRAIRHYTRAIQWLEKEKSKDPDNVEKYDLLIRPYLKERLILKARFKISDDFLTDEF